MEAIKITPHEYHVIILNTGYTARLLERIDDINERLEECEIPAKVLMIKYLSGRSRASNILEVNDTVPGMVEVYEGVTCVKTAQEFISIDVRDTDGDPASMGTIHIIMEQLSDMGYCAHLDATNIIEEVEFTYYGIRYLYISIDTESG